MLRLLFVSFFLYYSFFWAQNQALKSLYENKEYAKAFRKAKDIEKSGNKSAKAEANLYQALITIELYQMDGDAAFEVLKYFKSFMRRDQERKILQLYPKEVEQIKQYLQTATLLLEQESRYVAANYVHKTLLFALEGSNLTLETKSPPLKGEQMPTKVKKKDKQPDASVAQMLAYAKTKIGIRYHFGGTSDKGYDCSGFTMRVFETAGFQLPRTAQEQSFLGKKTDLTKAQPGDLIFFQKHHNHIDHVGIVTEVENNIVYMIHASSSRGIRIDKVHEGSYWHPRVKVLRRVF